MGYTKEEIESKIDDSTKNGVNKLYACDFINYKGHINGSKEPYTEAIVEQLYKNIIVSEDYKYNKKVRTGKNPQTGEELEELDYPTKQINGIAAITRTSSYWTKSHKYPTVDNNSPRVEENFVKNLVLNNDLCDELGVAVDYQTPIRDIVSDEIKCIDLITFNNETNELYLIEVKKEDSEETLLRACLEVQTYYQTIDKDKLIKDFKESGIIQGENISVKKAVLIFKKSNLAKEYNEVLAEQRPMLKKLIKDLNIRVCVK